ncbi:heterokaryon incompatibility protein [Fusarium heterosporum]|uniref:Heterokaryon incompatibility protein n=1 Tax=Fusarium heterosporum TaxID=42747 RepID=A0A8H5WXY4_FUSHE|nr:heterokaryon incompatibility protein [Fusarium heterosporum]
MFNHSPLSQGAREIRVLRFARAADGPADDDEPISLELQHVSLNDNISYAAVSYTWGTTTGPVDIKVNSCQFKITQNLHEALRQLRRDGVDSWLWIDAICIEQSNDLEKSWQIMQMREIFSHATGVYLWLGTGTIESDLTMDFISRVGPRALSCDIANLLNKTAIRRGIDYYIKQQSHPQRIDGHTASESKLGPLFWDLLNEDALLAPSPLINGISNILQREHWHRIWIIQEVALAKEALVVVGTKSVSLELFDATFTAIWYCMRSGLRRMHPKWYGFCKGLSITLYEIKSLYIRHRLRQIPAAQPVRLVDILWENGAAPGRPHYSATDPRDILFGLLGILTEGEARGIRVDYTKSVAEVFTALTRAMMSCANDDHVSFDLDFCNPGKSTGYLPTWVPDWRKIGMWGVRTYRINHYRIYKATGRLSGRGRALSVKGDANVLHSFGCRVDQITTVMHPPEWVQKTPYEPSWLKDPDDWLRSIATFTGLGSESGPGEDYIWRTITRDTCDTPPKLTHIPPQERTSIIEGMRTLRRKVMRLQDVAAESLTDQEIEFIHHGPPYNNFGSNSGALDDQQVIWFAANWRECLSRVNRNRTLFKTSKGMLGLGHVGIEVGDIVSLIWGVSSPIVLRQRHDGGFYFCGDAYVDGIMQGEYLQNNPEEEEFCIY